MHTTFFLRNVFIVFIDLCLENKVMLAGRFPCMVTDFWDSSGSNVTFWRPFCLCKLGGQDLKISLRNRIFWIQHTQIRLKSLVPNFYSKMLLTFTFSRNLTRLFHRPSTICFQKINLFTIIQLDDPMSFTFHF